MSDEGTPALSPHFFKREPDGSVRLRIRFAPDEASLIEEGAGDTPLLLYIHRVLNDRARYHIRKREQVEAAQQNPESPSDPAPSVPGGDEPLWTIDQLAAFLQVAVKSIRRWREIDAGPRAYRVGRHLRFKRADVLEWLEQQDASI